MVRLLKVISFAGGLFISAVSFAADQANGVSLRLTVDLDGDGKADTVMMSTSGTDTFENYTVQVGDSKFTGKFFAEEGELPEINLLQVYQDGPGVKRLLLVTAPDPSDCTYEILSFAQGKLVHLLTTSSPGCYRPITLPDGKVQVLTWQDNFWKRPAVYELDKTGTKLVPEAQTEIPVGISGYVKNLTSMQPANCRKSTIRAGSYAYVVVQKYDLAHKRYLMRDLNGACGWVPQEAMPAFLDGLGGGE